MFEIYEAARRQFSEKELVDLAHVVAINAWNPQHHPTASFEDIACGMRTRRMQAIDARQGGREARNKRTTMIDLYYWATQRTEDKDVSRGRTAIGSFQ